MDRRRDGVSAEIQLGFANGGSRDGGRVATRPSGVNINSAMTRCFHGGEGMQPKCEQDVAFDKLKRQEQLIRGAIGSNEATTRMRAIDTVLFDVLGWDRLRVETEKYCRGEGYADYAFFQNRAVCLVLEAKTTLLTCHRPGSRTAAKSTRVR